MRPFFMSIVSNSNHWMFLSSYRRPNGGVGRTATLHCFPITPTIKSQSPQRRLARRPLCLVTPFGSRRVLWEPFSSKYEGVYKLSRNLYKNSFGNKVKFEEVNHDLGLTFTYEWNSSDKFGFVRKSALINHGSALGNCPIH